MSKDATVNSDLHNRVSIIGHQGLNEIVQLRFLTIETDHKNKDVLR